MLQDMQELQTKLTEGQQKLKTLSEQDMKAVSQSPMPAELTKTAEAQLPIPMAVETFVSSLGVDLTDDQRSQLHGLLKRPSIDEDERSKRRKTEAPAGMASKRTLWVTLPQPSKGTAQGSWCPSPGTILMMIQTPYGFATLLLAQRKGGGQMFVKVQRNCHLQTRETFFFKHHKGTGEGEHTYEPLNVSQTATTSGHDFDVFASLERGVDGPTLGVPGPAVISIKGGALPTSSAGHSAQDVANRCIHD